MKGGGEGSSRGAAACLTGASGSTVSALATSISPESWVSVLSSFPQLTAAPQS